MAHFYLEFGHQHFVAGETQVSKKVFYTKYIKPHFQFLFGMTLVAVVFACVVVSFTNSRSVLIPNTLTALDFAALFAVLIIALLCWRSFRQLQHYLWLYPSFHKVGTLLEGRIRSVTISEFGEEKQLDIGFSFINPHGHEIVGTQGATYIPYMYSYLPTQNTPIYVLYESDQCFLML